MSNIRSAERLRSSFLAATALVGFATATPAAAEDGKITAAITGGTLGIGPEVSYQASDRIGVRGSLSLLTISHDFSSDDVDYAGKAKLKSGGVMLDFYPGSSGFRLSAGARINGNKAIAIATPASPVTINGTSYTPAQIGTLSGSLDFRSLAPVATLGFSRKSKGFVLGMEAGAMFQGRARVAQFTASGGGVAAADLAAERDELQDDVSKFKVYPVLQFSLGYRF